MAELWQRCLRRLEGELNAEDLHTWLMPLQAECGADGMTLYAANVRQERWSVHPEAVVG